MRVLVQQALRAGECLHREVHGTGETYLVTQSEGECACA